MGDKGFNFTPPPRRERKEFEPPPWEKKEFDRLARERREAEKSGSDRVPEKAVEEQAPEAVEVAHAAAETSKAPVTGGETAPREALDERRVEAMLFELKAEDASETRAIKTASLAAGAVLFLIGMMLVTWGVVMIVVATRRAEQGKGGVFVGLTIMMFGACFAGIGAWFVYRTLRQQGVL